MPRTPRALAEYQRKRDFSKTAEPAGGAQTPAPRGRLRFVIQKHAATRLHFDLRLEIYGVMKSCAVPKGPRLDPCERRLAMQVEDHPIEYNTFEGVIPQGEYGGGTVMLWDRGTYEPNDDAGPNDVRALREGLRKGRLKVRFEGKRMHGGWTLVRMQGRDENPDKPAWLFIKERDATADPSRDLVAEEMTSIATHRTMEQIASGRSRRWTRASGAEPAPSASSRTPKTSTGRKSAEMPRSRGTKTSTSTRKSSSTPRSSKSRTSPSSQKRTTSGSQKRTTSGSRKRVAPDKRSARGAPKKKQPATRRRS